MRKETLFLRAERKADGTHTYRIIEGDPLETSHSEDLFHKIFDQTLMDGINGEESEKPETS
jgi:hypothetical protein